MTADNFRSGISSAVISVLQSNKKLARKLCAAWVVQ